MYIDLFNPLIPEFKGYDEEWFLQIHLCNTAILFMASVLASSCPKGTLKGGEGGGGQTFTLLQFQAIGPVAKQPLYGK